MTDVTDVTNVTDVTDVTTGGIVSLSLKGEGTNDLTICMHPLFSFFHNQHTLLFCTDIVADISGILWVNSMTPS